MIGIKRAKNKLSVTERMQLKWKQDLNFLTLFTKKINTIKQQRINIYRHYSKIAKGKRRLLV